MQLIAYIRLGKHAKGNRNWPKAETTALFYSRSDLNLQHETNVFSICDLVSCNLQPVLQSVVKLVTFPKQQKKLYKSYGDVAATLLTIRKLTNSNTIYICSTKKFFEVYRYV